MLRRVTCALGVVLAFVACSSVPDITFDDDGGSSTEGGRTDGGGSDAVPTPCTPTGPESCTDGLDNDCNGKTDCEDPACTAGFACTDPAPIGWELVGFAANAKPNCPPGFGASTDISSVTTTGSGTCTCQCNTVAGSTGCAAGQATVAVSDQAVCTGGATAARAVSASAGCTTLAMPLDVPNGIAYVKATPPTPQATCTSATTLSVPPITTGRQCGTPAVGKGCTLPQVCAPKPTGVTLCAAKGGANACPTTFPKQHTAGGTADDKRVCNTCNCAPQACSETVTLFTAADCSVGAPEKSVAITSTCGAPAVKNVSALAYTSTTSWSGLCSSVAFNMASAGAIAWTAQETICCK